MKFVRQLDTSTKVTAAFVLLMCLSTALALALLSQLALATRVNTHTHAVSATTGAIAGATQKNSVRDLAAAGRAQQTDARAAPPHTTQATHNWALAAITGNLAVAVLLLWWLRAELARPLRLATGMARRMAQGDLRAPGATGAMGHGDTGLLLRSMRDMQCSLAAIIARLRTDTASLARGAGQLAAYNRQLALRTETPAGNQEQAGLADESASMAAALRDQAGALLRLTDAFLLGPEHAQPAARIKLVASNPGKLGTAARAMRSSATVVPVRQRH